MMTYKNIAITIAKNLIALIISSAFVGVGYAQYVDRNIELLDAGKGITITDSVSGVVQLLRPNVATPGDRIQIWFAAVKVLAPQGTTTACHDPCAITLNRSWGDYYVQYEEVDSSGNPLSPRRQSSPQPLLPFIPPTGALAACPLPVEVIGQDNFYKRCLFTAPSGAPVNSLLLYMRVFAPGYQTPPFDGKIAYQICQGSTTTTCTSWTNITNSNITQRDENRFYTLDKAHGIGGFRQVIEFTLPITNGAILTNSTNSIAFRFNGTDGVSSGFRVLAWNLLDSTTQTTITQYSITTNVVTASATAHPFNTNDDLRVFEAPGIHGRLNGSRHVTGTATNTFTFNPCGSGLGFYAISCTSPNGVFVVPITQASGTEIANYPWMAQQVSYAMRQIIPESTFTYDDPSTWVAPPGGNATNGASFFAGVQQLYTPNNPYFGNVNNSSINCASCHFSTTGGLTAGADLEMFNYSNQSLIQRTIFHGGSGQNGLDVAAYIRGLTPPVASNARPWNPAFQPCPGLDSNAANLWYAGGGIDCQLTYDNDAQEYMIPGCTMTSTGECTGGSFATWAPSNEMNMHELPQLVQFWTWNQWLPLVHPADGFPKMNFFGTAFATDFGLCNSGTNAQTFASYKAANGGYCTTWSSDYAATYAANLGGINPYLIGGPAASQDIAGSLYPSNWVTYRYGFQQWFMVKGLNILQPNLINMLATQYTDTYGATGDTPGYSSRGYGIMSSTGNNRFVFNSAFHIIGQTDHTPWMNQTVPFASFVAPSANVSPTWQDQSNSDYVMVMALNGGNRRGASGGPLDWPYTYAFLATTPGLYRPSAWLVATPWIVQPQVGWDVPIATGSSSGVFNYVPLRGDWLQYTNANQLAWLNTNQQITIYTNFANTLLGMLNHDTAANWLAGLMLSNGASVCNAGGASANWNGIPPGASSVCDALDMMLPMIDFLTNNTIHTTTDAIAAAAHAIFPARDFSRATGSLSATCAIHTFPDGTTWPRCSNAGGPG